MLDVAVAYNRYKFLGHEFLTWLWFAIENDNKEFKGVWDQPFKLQVGNRVALENRAHGVIESVVIKGDDAGLEEGMLALSKGAVVTELNLEFTSESLKWLFTIKGENLNVSSLKIPPTAPIEKPEDLEGAVIEKADLYDAAIQLIDRLFHTYIHLRLSRQWSQDVVPKIKSWFQQ
jgi:hypothetical protein